MTRKRLRVLRFLAEAEEPVAASAFFGMKKQSYSSVWEILESLEEQGWVRVTHRGAPNLYVITPEGRDRASKPVDWERRQKSMRFIELDAIRRHNAIEAQALSLAAGKPKDWYTKRWYHFGHGTEPSEELIGIVESTLEKMGAKIPQARRAPGIPTHNNQLHS